MKNQFAGFFTTGRKLSSIRRQISTIYKCEGSAKHICGFLGLMIYKKFVMVYVEYTRRRPKPTVFN